MKLRHVTCWHKEIRKIFKNSQKDWGRKGANVGLKLLDPTVHQHDADDAGDAGVAFAARRRFNVFMGHLLRLGGCVDLD